MREELGTKKIEELIEVCAPWTETIVAEPPKKKHEHELKEVLHPYKEKSGHNKYYCDECRKTFDYKSQHCTMCEFDACPDCYKQFYEQKAPIVKELKKSEIPRGDLEFEDEGKTRQPKPDFVNIYYYRYLFKALMDGKFVDQNGEKLKQHSFSKLDACRFDSEKKAEKSFDNREVVSYQGTW